jgi:hypothetical protein
MLRKLWIPAQKITGMTGIKKMGLLNITTQSGRRESRYFILKK